MIRAIVPGDLAALRGVIEANDLFPPALLDGMVSDYLAGASRDGWLTDDDDGPVAVAYYAPERMTEGTWNLLLIAVHPARQREGRGAALLRCVEAALGAAGGRLLLVETSGLAGFAGTRAFYLGQGYAAVARIPDYYQAGEDKVVFAKSLAPLSVPTNVRSASPAPGTAG